MAELLFEIGTEEIPARFMVDIEKQVKELLISEIETNNLLRDKVEVYSTYRRIVIKGWGIKAKESVDAKEVKGPPANVAFKDDVPTKAAEGFAKRNGVDVSALKVVDGYVYAIVKEEIRSPKEVLPEIITTVLNKMYLPIAMKWGSETQQFIRPVHWILFLLDNEVLPFTFAGKSSSNTTRGHRIFSTRDDNGWAKDLEVTFDSYDSVLSKENVIVDPKTRQEKIVSQLKEKSSQNAIEAIIDEELVEEVCYLAEDPSVVMAEFPARFLEVPEECLIKTMQKNQKYFPARIDGKLTNKYFIVADHAYEGNENNIITGNNKVLVARLEDASFFFNEDKKVALMDQVPRLKSITFQEKLGSLYAKQEKVVEVASWLNRNVFDNKYADDLIKDTVFLTKADLVTLMVYEFTDLQGIMGQKYALVEGRSQEQSDAIFEHYLPRFSGDIVPDTNLGTICAIADKIDSIAACFSIDLIPTGSADPYALRRAAQGIVSIVIEKGLDIDLSHLIEYATELYGGKNRDKVEEFFTQRIRTMFIDKGYSYDFVDAVLAVEMSNIIDINNRLNVLVANRDDDNFKPFIEAAIRMGRISGKCSSLVIDESIFEENEEKILYAEYQKLLVIIDSAQGDLDVIFDGLTKLIPSITLFFDKVMVMAEDEKVKNNRLALVKNIYNHYLEIADFEKVVI